MIRTETTYFTTPGTDLTIGSKPIVIVDDAVRIVKKGTEKVLGTMHATFDFSSLPPEYHGIALTSALRGLRIDTYG